MRWWKPFVTPQNILTAVLAVFAAGGYWQDSKQQKEQIEKQERRLDRIEERLNTERSVSDDTYMRKDNVELELKAIRLQIEGLRRDLR